MNFLGSLSNETRISYRNVPSPDERCLQAQSILHPVCAIQPESLPGAKPPSCHEIAASCKMDPRCR